MITSDLTAVTNVLVLAYCARQKTMKDVSNFDREFTSEAPKLTPTDKLFIMNLDQTVNTASHKLEPEHTNVNLDQTELLH